MSEGIGLENVLCIAMGEGAYLPVNGNSMMRHVSFVQWDRLPPEVRDGLIKQGWVATEAGQFGAMTRDAVLDRLALKMAGITPAHAVAAQDAKPLLLFRSDGGWEMSYDLDALRAAEKVAAFFVAHAEEAEAAERNRSTTEDGHELKADDFYLYEEAVAVRTILQALPGLLDDAALGLAVRAAAERDGPEREAIARQLFEDWLKRHYPDTDPGDPDWHWDNLPDKWRRSLGHRSEYCKQCWRDEARAAARALVAMGGQDGR